MAGTLHDRGLEVSKKVHGAHHVERALASTDRYSKPSQNFKPPVAADRIGHDLVTGP